MTVEVEVNGLLRHVSVERVASDPNRFRVTWDGVSRLVDAHSLNPTRLSLIFLGAGWRSYEARLDEGGRGELVAYVTGTIVRAVVNSGRRAFRFDESGLSDDREQRVTAPMPGKVVRLLVAVGDEVAARQAVAVVEAMKMENELVALRSGRVKEVAVQEGAVVESGKVLMVIEQSSV